MSPRAQPQIGLVAPVDEVVTRGPATAARVLCLVLIVAGVLGLKLTAP